jgi:hypothetical protein
MAAVRVRGRGCGQTGNLWMKLSGIFHYCPETLPRTSRKLESALIVKQATVSHHPPNLIDLEQSSGMLSIERTEFQVI